MRSSIPFIKAQNITISIHWTFLFFLVWVAVAYAVTGASLQTAGWALLLLLAILASIFLHELGHALVASCFGIQSKNITLMPVGGVATIERLPQNPLQELAISVAGPLVNLLIAGAISVYYEPAVPDGGLHIPLLAIGSFLQGLYVANLVLGLVNLLPAFPLDGGRLLRALLSYSFNFIKATAMVSVFSRVVGALLILSGLLLQHPYIMGAGAFILFFSGFEKNYLKLKDLTGGIKVKDALMYDYNSLLADMKVSDAASILRNNHSKFFIVMHQGKPVGTIHRMQVIKALADRAYEQSVIDLMRDDLHWLDGNTALDKALGKLSRDEERIYPVLVNGHFAGVINFQHIIEHLLLHKTYSAGYGKMRSLAELV